MQAANESYALKMNIIVILFNLLFFFASIFSLKLQVIGVKMSVGNAKMVRIRGVSSYPGFELSGSNRIVNGTQGEWKFGST